MGMPLAEVVEALVVAFGTVEKSRKLVRMLLGGADEMRAVSTRSLNAKVNNPERPLRSMLPK
jgi:hypothetical protein